MLVFFVLFKVLLLTRGPEFVMCSKVVRSRLLNFFVLILRQAMRMPGTAVRHSGIEPRVAVIAAGTSRLRSVLKALLHSLP